MFKAHPLPAPADPGRAKPKNLSKVLWFIFSLFIVYGTTIPFHFRLDGEYLRKQISGIDWYPLRVAPGHHISWADYIQNILLFLPFGFLGYLGITDRKSGWKPFAVIALGCFLSAFVEFLQLFSETRCTALTDVIWDTVGAAGGVLAAWQLRHVLFDVSSLPALRRFLRAESAYLCLLFGTMVVIGEWEPFDFSLDVGTVWPKVKYVREHFFALSPSPDDLLALFRQAGFAFFACRLFAEARTTRGRLAGVLCACGIGWVLEFSQFIIESRMPELYDAFVATVGSAMGYYLSRLPRFHRRPLASGAVFIGGFVGAIALKGLAPYHFHAFTGKFNWFPFLSYYQYTSFVALSDVLEKMLAYANIGIIGAYLTDGKPWVLGITLPVALIVSGGIEVLHTGLPGRYADVTNVVSALAGVWGGHLAITRGWSAYRDYAGSMR